MSRVRVPAFEGKHARYTAVVDYVYWVQVECEFWTHAEDGLTTADILSCKNTVASCCMCMFSLPAVGPISPIHR